MTARKIVVVIALSVLAPITQAQGGADAQGSEPLQVEIGSSLDTLNNGYANWRSNYIEGAKKLGNRHAIYGSLRETERFRMHDAELMAGIYYPLAQRWTLVAEGNASPTHNILAKWSAMGQMQYSLDNGWGAHLGLRHTVYNSALSNVLLVTGERYWSSYRATYTHSITTLAGTGSSSSGLFQMAKYYDELNWIGLNLAKGSEIENLGPVIGIQNTSTQSAGLNGRHWFSREWGVSYEAAITKQGAHYTRNTLRLGLRHQF